MTTDFRALCAELLWALENAISIIYHEDGTKHISTANPIVERARAALADESASVIGEPSFDELRNLWANAPCIDEAPGGVAFARAVLARWGNPAPQPVPVSERLQQMEDLAGDAVAGLRYIEQCHGRLYGVGWDRVYKKADRLKPAHALPVPGQEVEG